MLLSPLSPRHAGQGVQLDTNWNLPRCSIEQFEKLHFRVFQSRIRHVVKKRNFDALRTCPVAFARTNQAAAFSLRPTWWNPAAFDDQWHDFSPKSIRLTTSTSHSGLIQRLTQVLKNVVDMLDPHTKTHHLRSDAYLRLFFRSELPVRGRRRVTRQ